MKCLHYSTHQVSLSCISEAAQSANQSDTNRSGAKQNGANRNAAKQDDARTIKITTSIKTRCNLLINLSWPGSGSRSCVFAPSACRWGRSRATTAMADSSRGRRATARSRRSRTRNCRTSRSTQRFHRARPTTTWHKSINLRNYICSSSWRKNHL